MTVITAFELTSFSRPVNPRAKRMQDIVASVPD